MPVNFKAVVEAFPERLKTFLFATPTSIQCSVSKEGIIIYEVHNPHTVIRCLGISRTPYNGDICIVYYDTRNRDCLCVPPMNSKLTRAMAKTVQKCRHILVDIVKDSYIVDKNITSALRADQGFTLSTHRFVEPCVSDNVDLWNII